MSNEFSREDKISLAIQSGLNLIPQVGGTISTAYFGYRNELRIKRLESFFEEVSEFIAQANIAIPEIGRINEEKVFNLVEELSDKVEKEYSSKKREHFKGLLVNILMDPEDVSFDTFRYFVQTLSDMTELELDLIGFLLRQQNAVKVGNIDAPGINQNAIVGGVNRLKSYGFIDAFTAQMVISDSANNALLEDVQLNSFGRQFVDYLERA